MVDTVRSLSALQALLADNTAGDISAQDVRDFLVSTYPAWTSYVPVLGGTGVSIGNGTITGSYNQQGDIWVEGWIKCVLGSTTNMGSGFTVHFTLPNTPHADMQRLNIGRTWLENASPAAQHITTNVLHFSTNIAQIRVSSSAWLTNTTPWTWATGDEINISFGYRPAAV